MSWCAVAVGGVLLPCMPGLAHVDDIANLKDPGMISAGSQLFQVKQCTYCHGHGGNGAIKLAGRSHLEPRQSARGV